MSSIIFEEENDEKKEVPITALAITNYIDDNRYYLCDTNWEVVNDYLLESIDEALGFAKRNFDVHEHDWIIINS
ncbi:hypothetical protein [Brevibacillus sp. DP1.3A]|uniref:hypothetical protein n=1 Tax=Brevibacillus sp. DP1.3A TaxID=2738867 RepID=UPI001D16AAE1|nr:hypothetical protein [Brevibacillus sp. DP1.3A]MED1914446.1 hypothetical protein [Bacillus thuringiensis]UED74406.1 hypothetical protein HP399_027430 [Brevibacillus sp. DP1.3A]